MRIHSSYQPHEQRVLDERDDLLDKLRKLRAFILDGRGRFGGLPHAERDRLKHQEEVMSEYAAILAERIEAFPNPVADKNPLAALMGEQLKRSPTPSAST